MPLKTRNKRGIYIETHGLSHTHLYSVWHGMMNRCYRAYASFYYNYGEKGIRVCEKWEDVTNFGYLTFLGICL